MGIKIFAYVIAGIIILAPFIYLFIEYKSMEGDLEKTKAINVILQKNNEKLLKANKECAKKIEVVKDQCESAKEALGKREENNKEADKKKDEINRIIDKEEKRKKNSKKSGKAKIGSINSGKCESINAYTNVINDLYSGE